jgi:thioredoxin-related protein
MKVNANIVREIFIYLACMKHFFITLFSICICITLNAQTASTFTAEQLAKFNAAPANKVVKMDSIAIAFNKLIPKQKATVLMFFNPDCDHCQDQTTEIVSHIDTLKNINFVLVSNRPLFMIKDFTKKYKTNKCKNIKVVQDNTNALVRHYEVASFPSLIIFDDKGQFVAKYMSSIVKTIGFLNATKPKVVN